MEQATPPVSRAAAPRRPFLRQRAPVPDAPTSAAPEQVGFTAQPRLRWFSVRLLLQTAREAVVSQVFGAFVDRRELQASTPVDPGELVVDFSRRDELWIDYASDLGDGFNAAATIAGLVGRTEPLELDGAGPIRPAELLVFGGDQAYPSGAKEDYDNRLVGPYRAMLPWSAEPGFAAPEPARHVLAVPGNHDWYDGLVSFLKLFCQRDRWIGGWRTRQRRSYFAVRLPHRWWLWAIDIQLDADVDEPQLEYFRQVAAELSPGDALILCWAKPSWVAAGPRNPEVYAQIEYFQRQVLDGTGARVRISLSGDTHHYARYAQPRTGEQKITAGGGGAYLSGTHNLPRALHLPPQEARAPRKRESETFELRTTYPEHTGRMAWKVLWRIYGNKSFCLIPAVAYLLLGHVLDAGWTALTPAAGRSAVLPILATTLVVSAFGYVLYAFAGDRRRRVAPRLAAAGLHLLLHLAAVLAVVRFARFRDGALAGYGPEPVAVVVCVLVAALTLVVCAIGVLDDYPPRAWGFPLGWRRRSVLIARVAAGLASIGLVAWWVLETSYLDAGLTDGEFLGLVAFGVGVLVGPLLVAVYLLVAGGTRWNVNGNELFSAQAIEDHKSFLSLHVTASGVELHAVAVDAVPRRWRFVPDRPFGPWFEPADGWPAPVRLIETVTVPRLPGPVSG
ncbi:MAG: hypothetical protein ACT4RN_00920 [Pseudonocardia sp.]